MGHLMKEQLYNTEKDGGFVLIASLLILLVLTVLGIAVNRNTTIEWQIAMNDRVHKETFYNADAATELASEVLEQSIACLGFGQNPQGMTLVGYGEGKTPDEYYHVYIEPSALGFWRNYSPNGIVFPADDANRDIVYPAVVDDPSGAAQFDRTATDRNPHANINIGGNTKLTAGAAIQMAAGYEGVGKSLAVNGAVLLYDIKVTQIGPRNSLSKISIQYGHVLGSEGTCNYP